MHDSNSAMQQNLFAAWLTSIAHGLLPGQCALCGQNCADPLCSNCIARHVHTPTERCTCCGIPLQSSDKSSLCGGCLSNPPSFDATVVATAYAAPIDQLVQGLKFHARLPLAATFARLLALAFTEDMICQIDLITIVPLSRARLAERGFNQAMEIARPLARLLKKPLLPSLSLRVRDTSAQASLPLSERRVNMRSAFAVHDRQKLTGQRLLVVDDVMTTGCTLNELAACLKRHGALRVTNAVFARTAPH